MPSPATLSNLLQQMYQNKEVLQGWDAVMNLLESSVNSFFMKQWNQQTGGAGRLCIAVVWCEGVLPAPGHQGWFTNVTQVQVDLGPPLADPAFVHQLVLFAAVDGLDALVPTFVRRRVEHRKQRVLAGLAVEQLVEIHRVVDRDAVDRLDDLPGPDA